MFSKRSEQIDEDAGPGRSYRLRSRLARSNRPDKDDDHTPEQLMDRWHGELDAIGHTPASILDSDRTAAPARLSGGDGCPTGSWPNWSVGSCRRRATGR